MKFVFYKHWSVFQAAGSLWRTLLLRFN